MAKEKNVKQEKSQGRPPKILVVGTGAIGGFYSAKLAQAGAQVSVVCRSDYDVIKAQGIQVTSVWGDFHFAPARVLRSVEDYPDIADYILVGLKVLPEVDPVAMIRAAVRPQTAIFLLQNGIDIELPVAQAFPDNEVISGLAFICVSRTAPGQVHHQDFGRLAIGCYPSGYSVKAQQLGGLFESVGVPCLVTPEVVTARWQKLVWNAPFNPISVLGGGVDTESILVCPPSAQLARQVMSEVCLLARSSGHELAADIIDRNLTDTLRMKPYKTSMLLDFEAGRPMEVEAILGNAVRIAQRLGISVPYLESLYGLLALVQQRKTARSCGVSG
jgi:2-dehydropantoate 2-reductase